MIQNISRSCIFGNIWYIWLGSPCFRTRNRVSEISGLYFCYETWSCILSYYKCLILSLQLCLKIVQGHIYSEISGIYDWGVHVSEPEIEFRKYPGYIFAMKLGFGFCHVISV